MNENNSVETNETEEDNNSIPLEDASEVIEVSEYVEQEPKVKKHIKALSLIEQAKQMVKDAEEQTQACKLLLADDLREYDNAKNSLHSGGMDACISLLEQLGYQPNEANKITEENVVVFEPKEEVEPIVLKNVSSGRFTGFLYSLVSATATSVGLVYLATEKLGITLDISKIPSQDTVKSIVEVFSTSVGLEPNIYVGASVFGFCVVSVMALVYVVRVTLKGSSNLRFSTKQLEEAKLYIKQKSDCKTAMDKIDEHIKDTISTLKLYEVIFNEQKGKLERIMHIEGNKNKSTEYHEKSYAEIRETRSLVRAIESFMSISMSKDGHLSDDSIEALNRAKLQLNKMLERLY